MLTDSDGQDVLGVFNEYAYTLECKGSIYSKIQITAYSHEVDDVPMKLGGKQHIICHNHGGAQRIFPLHIENGLCYLHQRYPTVDGMNTLPQQIMTSDKVWDPSLFDTNMTLKELIKNFPVSTERDKGFYDEKGDLLLQFSEAVQKSLNEF